MQNDTHNLIEQLVPGAIGSLGALIWIKGKWPKKVAMLIFGVVTTYYMAPAISAKLGLDSNISAFLVGLFGMSVVDGIFRAWETLALGEILRDAIRHWFGLPQKDGRDGRD